MKLVVDTNILFNFFKEDSFTKDIILSKEIELIAPKKAEEEIIKYKELIKNKNNINENQFKELLSELKQIVKISEKDYYQKFLSEAEKFSPDIADAEFLALCIKEKIDLWSKDKLLKSQNKVRVINTEELIEILF